MVDVTPNDSVLNTPIVHIAATAPKLTCAQQIAKIEKEMSDDEWSAYLDARDMDSKQCQVVRAAGSTIATMYSTKNDSITINIHTYMWHKTSLLYWIAEQQRTLLTNEQFRPSD